MDNPQRAGASFWLGCRWRHGAGTMYVFDTGWGLSIVLTLDLGNSHSCDRNNNVPVTHVSLHTARMMLRLSLADIGVDASASGCCVCAHNWVVGIAFFVRTSLRERERGMRILQANGDFVNWKTFYELWCKPFIPLHVVGEIILSEMSPT